jgi:type III secretory pathway component EscU
MRLLHLLRFLGHWLYSKRAMLGHLSLRSPHIGVASCVHWIPDSLLVVTQSGLLAVTLHRRADDHRRLTHLQLHCMLVLQLVLRLLSIIIRVVVRVLVVVDALVRSVDHDMRIEGLHGA